MLSDLYYHPERNATEQISQHAQGQFRHRRFLLVEDSPDNQLLITAYLRGTEANITIADNGAEGVETAKATHFDIILMDIQMPLLDGHQATQALRAFGLKQPIIAMTAHAMQEEKRKCLVSGFSAYVSKPLNRKLLIDTIQEHLSASIAPASV